jgi:tetraacyldisaccharide 4'-kinase
VAAAPWRQRLVKEWSAPRPTLLCRLLWPLSWVYGVLAAAHAALYRTGILPRQRAPVPLIVIGNLVVGGAGKTPAVIATVEILRGQGRTPGVVSRGHGAHARGPVLVTGAAQASDVGDEPLMIRLRTGAPLAIGRDRIAAIRLLCDAHPEVDVIVADDGLQHHRLLPDLAVIVIDDRGHGNGLLLPAGPLRQWPPERLRGNCLVLYSAGIASTSLPGHLGHRRLAGAVALADWWHRVPARPELLTALRGRDLVAAAGLARPERFFSMLRDEGLTFGVLPLDDHFDFSTLPWPVGTADAVVSEKDAVKLDPGRIGATRVWVVPLDFVPEAGFGAALARLLPD